MKKITVLSGLLLLAGLAAQAQERVAEYNVRPAVTVRTPLQGDSINFKGDKFTTGNLLKTKVSLDFDGGRYERMVADTAGYVTVAKADKDNLFYLFATNLRAERFMKGKLNVYSPARFEVFVNGESKQVKETAEDSLSQVRPTAVSLRMDPEADYEIVIKLLSSADDKMQPMLKCEFEKEKDFAPGENLVVTEYINNMPQLLAAADLVIARSGALTLAELEAVGRASVLIPSPNVAENHQYYNALELQKAGAAVVIEEKNLTGDGLVKTVETLLTSPGKLAEMGANAKTLGNPHSLDLITEKLLKLVNG